VLVHLQRDFRRHSEGLAEQKTFGEQGLALTRQVFAARRAHQHEHHDRERLKAEILPIQTELRQLLEQASPKSQRTRWHRRFANNLLNVSLALWTFTTVDGVQPTNNPAERALRSRVIHRKVSLGTQSKNVSDSPSARSPPPPPVDSSAARLPQRTDHRPQPRRSIPRAGQAPGTERLLKHVSVQSSGPGPGIPALCSESCRYGSWRGGGDL
jgi:transposase